MTSSVNEPDHHAGPRSLLLLACPRRLDALEDAQQALRFRVLALGGLHRPETPFFASSTRSRSNKIFARVVINVG